MTTVIRPGNGFDWSEVLSPKDMEDWRIIDNVLVLVAGWMTRGKRKANKQLFGTIAYNVADYYDPVYVGKFIFYLRKVIEQKPIAYQEWNYPPMKASAKLETSEG